MHTEVLKKLNHQKPKATKWLKFKDFFNTQRVALLLGCCLLVIGTAVYLAVTPAPQGEDEPVQKQQAPTLEEAQQSPMQEQTQPQAEASEPTQAEQSQAEPPEQTPASNSSAQTVKQAQTKLQMPVAGEIIRAFSGEHLVYNKTLNAWSTHNGIDIAAKEGEAVGAALAGEVTSAKMDSTLGWVVTLSHTDDRSTVYAGLSDLSVKEGDKVNAGQQLGTAGIPPFESDLGVHVHFEYLENGKYADPAEQMAAQ